MIVTFYSFKGGVGRTLALGNVGVVLPQNGHRVLLVDFDLEAPGLIRYLEREFGGDLQYKRGLLELLERQRDVGDATDHLQKYAVKIVRNTEGGLLELLTSGHQDKSYPKRRPESRFPTAAAHRFRMPFIVGIVAILCLVGRMVLSQILLTSAPSTSSLPSPQGGSMTVLAGHTGAVDTVAWSPDARTLASGSVDQIIRLWNVTDLAHPALVGPPLTGHTGAVTSVAFSPDGRTLASGSADETIRLWNMTDKAHPLLGEPLIGHTNTVTSVAFSPDGPTLASGSTDETIRLWNMTNRVQPLLLGPLLTSRTGVLSASFSLDGRILANGSADGTVQLRRV